MKAAARWAAGYVFDFFRERVTAADFAGERFARVLVAADLGEAGEAAARRLFPGAELRRLDGRSDWWRVRRLGCDAVFIGMAGGGMRERIVGLLSAARHKLLVPSPDYVYRFGIREGGPALLWAVVDRFLIAPFALVWLGLLALGMKASGLLGRAEGGRGERWRAERVLVLRLAPTETVVQLLKRLRRMLPEAHLAALLGSEEGRVEVAAVCDEVVTRRGGGLRKAVREGGFDSVIIAGGGDYGLGRTYLKAVLLARLCAGATRYQWEPGEDAPGRPLGKAVRAAFLRALGRFGGPGREVVRAAARPWLRRAYGRLPRMGPRLVQIGITEGCNYHCLMCPFHNPRVDGRHREAERPRMSYGMYARLLGDLKRMGTEGIDLCGNGEPLTHPEAMEMIALAREMGFSVSLATNGALLTGEKARRLVELGVERMHASINAGSEETYAKMHPGTPPGAMGGILDRLREMAEYADATGRRPVEVEYSVVLTRLNMGEMVRMVEAARRARARRFMLILMGPVEADEGLRPGPDDWWLIRQDVKRARARLEKLGIASNLEELETTGTAEGTRSVYEEMPCYMGHEFALILGDGSVIFCCHCSRSLGNLHKDGFERIWKCESYQQARGQAMALPASKQPLAECGCFHACSHVSANVEVHRALHGERGVRKLA